MIGEVNYYYVAFIIVGILSAISVYKYREISSYFIKINKLIVTRFYFRLLLFLFGIGTFTYGIHDGSFEERMHSKFYKKEGALLSDANIISELDFSKNGYAENNEKPQGHSYSKVEYLIFLDNTRSVEDSIDGYLSSYLKSKYKKFQTSNDKFEKLSGQSKLMIGVLHKILNIKDVDTVYLNIKIYKGNNDFRNVFIGGWQKLGREKSDNAALIDSLVNILHEEKTPEGNFTYFKNIYNQIIENIDNKEYDISNTNVIILSDFAHEFESDDSLQDLKKIIGKINMSDCRKFSLVELPIKNEKNKPNDLKNSINGVEALLNEGKSKTEIYSWIYEDIKKLEFSELEKYFCSIITFPDPDITDIRYDKDKINIDECVKRLGDFNYFSYKHAPVKSSKSILSNFHSMKIVSTSAEIGEKLKDSDVKSIEVTMAKDVKDKRTQESKLRFISMKPIPSGSIRILFYVKILFLTTIFFISLVYFLCALERWDKGNISNIKWKNNIRSLNLFLMVVAFVMTVYEICDIGDILYNVNQYFIILLAIIYLNVFPLLFFRFRKKA